jgi:NAD(P)-dependent dehydrogenase (short-subunit alcohol dehydrogenase family)
MTLGPYSFTGLGDMLVTKQLEGRVALVTGASQGIGQGCSRAIAEAGAKMFIAQRNVENAEEEAKYLRTNFGAVVEVMKVDVTKRAEVDAMVKASVDKFGKLDILVNNAGASVAKRLENTTDEEMSYWFDLNYFSVFWAMRAAFPYMKAQKYGRIINMGSLNGVNAHMFTAPYNASKEAVRALTRTAAVEWGGHGITANIICPAANSRNAEEYFAANPAMGEAILQQIPAGRFGQAEQDIGPVALFLASEASRFMTGNTIYVDGGGHINGVPWRPYVED